MADERTEPTVDGTDEAALAVAARHALHDEALVVAFATATLDPDDETDEIERARGLVERCVTCKALHVDLTAIGDAIRADARGTVRAPRDFRLTVDDARRLGGFVRVDGFLTRLRRSMSSFARPIGASMATLGLVGILIGSTSLSGGAAMTATEDNHLAQETAAPVFGAASGSTDRPKATDGRTAYGPTSPAPNPTSALTEREDAVTEQDTSGLVLGGSVILLVAGTLLLIVGFRRRPPRGTGVAIP